MKGVTRALVAALAGAGLAAFVAAPAFSAEEFCPMGGTLIKVEVDREKALEWGKDQRKALVVDEGGESWSVLAISRTDDDVAILIRPGSVFFGIAGKGREVEENDVIKAFGNDLDGLRAAIRKDMGELRKDDVVDIDGGDVQPLADAAGLGTLEKSGRDWKLTTEKCQGLELDTSEL